MLRLLWLLLLLPVALLLIKLLWVVWGCACFGNLQSEKRDILQRRNYLVSRLCTTPQQIIAAYPSEIGEQFQGEWAIYSCSMLAEAMSNMTRLYPETQTQNIAHIDTLIQMVMSPDLRWYDACRWGEDPLETLAGQNSHLSYLSHLVWMICRYKMSGGDGKYDQLLHKLCEALNRRMLSTPKLNIETYPYESIYIPDMLVAVVALRLYADLYHGEYGATVAQWLNYAKTEWLDAKTGLLYSMLNRDGTPCYSEVKGSYSALNCYFLTLLDEEFAKEQYEQLKMHFWKRGFLSGLKESQLGYLKFGFDIDAGPILFELSPSGTAFMTGSATYFEDKKIRGAILRTAEVAGHTVQWGKQRHYLLGGFVPVGEAIMLAMRTNVASQK